MSELKDAIYQLSQDEGLFDHEIAARLGYHRTSITRYRCSFKIPHANLSNRQDKKEECRNCGFVRLIKRSRRKRKYCASCREIVRQAQLEKKRESTRQRTKKHSAGMLINP